MLDKGVHWRSLSEDERKRQEAILEFVSTEASYHDRLVTLHEVFYLNAAKPLAADERAVIFQNLPDLITQSSILLADLRSRQVEGRGIMSSASDVYLEHVRNKSFECFRTYCAGHEEGSRLVAERAESNRSFAKLLKESLSDPRCACLDLTSFLLEPVQRLARYPLLLKQILHYTERGHRDHQATLQAVLASEELLHSVNESVRRHESAARLSYIQSHLVPLDGEVLPELVGQTRRGLERSILLEGPIWKCRSKRKLSMVLTPDMLLLLEPHGDRLALYRPPLALDEIAVREINFDLLDLKLAHGLRRECAFEILRGSQSVCVATESVADKERYLKDISNAKKGLLNDRPARNVQMQLPCMGTIRISTRLSRVADISTVLELNMQRVTLRPGQQIVLSMSSYDNILRIIAVRPHKYAPDEALGHHDLSLDFLEYYGERPTDRINVALGPFEVGIILQFRAA